MRNAECRLRDKISFFLILKAGKLQGDGGFLQEAL